MGAGGPREHCEVPQVETRLPLGAPATSTEHSPSPGCPLRGSSSSTDPREQQGFPSTSGTPLSSQKEVCIQTGSCGPSACRGLLPHAPLRPLLPRLRHRSQKPDTFSPPPKPLRATVQIALKALGCVATHTRSRRTEILAPAWALTVRSHSPFSLPQ